MVIPLFMLSHFCVRISVIINNGEVMIKQVLTNILAGVVAGIFIGGCASMPPCPVVVESGDSAAEKTISAEAESAEFHEPVGVLAVEDALSAALLRNPQLAAYSFGVRAAEARIMQSRALPNPGVVVGVSEYDRGGAGYDSAETSLTLGQLFELGGKRRWRMRVAEAKGELAGWDYEEIKLAVFGETASRFMAVAAGQERVELAKAAEVLAVKTDRAVSERVNAGKEPPFHASKSSAELGIARMEVMQAENNLKVARKRLAAMWGGRRASFEKVKVDFENISKDVPSLESMLLKVSQNPALARQTAELRLRKAFLASEKAARVPDLHAFVGVQYFQEDSSDALSFGVGLPLPLFDRNRGNIAAAENAVRKAEEEQMAVAMRVETELSEAHSTLLSSYQRVEAVRTKVVPAMKQAFEAASEGYAQGKFGFLDMLDAQRGVVEANGLLIDALSDYHKALIDIQRITGSGIK